ncbi:hypothetical protein [Methylocystis heyeri]|uniref:Sulfotransferase family 2 domain-containing protein n=1 Tax=Methylocystis heyeri TaxID=391905 RepID=A0A6B8KK43_9HYPH|nr:hypothetical protein [Methylocystis heyeri]QGM46988.1 hypothetical protein H2LOC_015535 [Methylocystis heyeri]
MSSASEAPLLVYVHVPKTAGTTINRILGGLSPLGVDAFHFHALKPEFLETARRSDWISGHLGCDVFRHLLAGLGREIDFLSAVREPVAQICSHLNYSFHRSKSLDYFDRHSLHEQRIDADVMTTDFSNPTSVIKLLLNWRNLFLNLQSRLVIGEDFDRLSESEVDARLASYKFIATERNLFDLVDYFGFHQSEARKSLPIVNKAQYCFDPSIFDHPELRRFLHHHHRHDLRLYQKISLRRWDDPPEPFRPSFPFDKAFTEEHFDEESYLAANPEVGLGVQAGVWSSGWDHFDKRGRAEGRGVRRRYPPLAEPQS